MDLEKHKENECILRPAKCPYCDYTCQFFRLPDHSALCQSRTDACPHCKKYVRLADWDVHATQCTSKQSDERLYICTLCQMNQATAQVADPIDISFKEEELITHFKTQHSNFTAPMVCPICFVKKEFDLNMVKNIHAHLNVHELQLLQKQQWRQSRNRH
eukprot:TRINITY_DN8941_c0_g1_i2.p1 TRINITY_DN8941_c0_g1~~TRINITY_DN8941_c0_g1_i2.p1  ORF type:complete len:159 (+),score=3.49 TRINITY_DN8941_c0_g1_i2:187-663(+)